MQLHHALDPHNSPVINDILGEDTPAHSARARVPYLQSEHVCNGLQIVISAIAPHKFDLSQSQLDFHHECGTLRCAKWVTFARSPLSASARLWQRLVVNVKPAGSVITTFKSNPAANLPRNNRSEMSLRVRFGDMWVGDMVALANAAHVCAASLATGTAIRFLLAQDARVRGDTHDDVRMQPTMYGRLPIAMTISVSRRPSASGGGDGDNEPM
jgi:hypothetical protein